MRIEQPAPAWCSVAIAELLGGAPRDGVVVAAGRHAAYAVFGEHPSVVVAVVGPRGVRLPLAMQVDEIPVLRAGAPAAIGGRRLRMAGHEWRATRWWDPRPRIAAPLVRKLGDELPWLMTHGPGHDVGIPVHEAVEAAHRLAMGQPSNACALLGSGPGFTPAGDDVVAGALAGLSLADALDPVSRDAILLFAEERTTTLSAALLRCAARGEVVPEVARLMRAVAKHDEPEAVAAADAALAIGATSGPALLLGLAAALRALRGIDLNRTAEMEMS